MPTEILYEERDHVGVITLNQPEARNALTFTTYAELTDAVRSTAARCLVVTGADPAFCSGDDVKQVMAGAGERVSSGLRAEPQLTPAADALLHTDVPVIAAVNGAAVGWGMELALPPAWDSCRGSCPTRTCCPPPWVSPARSRRTLRWPCRA